ncbi:hypothetical protein ACYATL_02955 [Actinotignum timonense]|uniref:hypothetical protein n=1 Tax=Actinotignum TaxID=1653174 RepID=UPI00254A146D|nr:hypothetical protein [Actinotignum timonense]MDK6907441.1 hypothetical protein [Actinotignum timonense]MDK8782658.1 hypothetical protein [Actinotignum timonense]MDY5139080.1 hypothetical protein [Actinotignum timonense]
MTKMWKPLAVVAAGALILSGCANNALVSSEGEHGPSISEGHGRGGSGGAPIFDESISKTGQFTPVSDNAQAREIIKRAIAKQDEIIAKSSQDFFGTAIGMDMSMEISADVPGDGPGVATIDIDIDVDPSTRLMAMQMDIDASGIPGAEAEGMPAKISTALWIGEGSKPDTVTVYTNMAGFWSKTEESLADIVDSGDAPASPGSYRGEDIFPNIEKTQVFEDAENYLIVGPLSETMAQEMQGASPGLDLSDSANLQVRIDKQSYEVRGMAIVAPTYFQGLPTETRVRWDYRQAKPLQLPDEARKAPAESSSF